MTDLTTHSFLALVAALVLSGCAGGDMSSFRFERDTASLTSLASDGALLADQAAEGRAPSQFVAVHASEVGAEVGDLASVVRSTHGSDEVSDRKVTRLAQLAERASGLLEALEHAPNDEALARRTRLELSGIADQAEMLGESV
jgi:hypothetical protein